MPISDDLDREIRTAAFIHVRRMLEIRDPLTSEDLARGLLFRGDRIPLINPQRGIFKPKEMKYLLSIKTVVPRKGAKVWYDDQRAAHDQIYQGDETIEYSFMGANPEAADNRWLREAMQNRIPLIYFLGAYRGHYHAIIPATIVAWDARSLRAEVSVGLPGELRADPQETALERRYALRQVKARLHQTLFRAAVIAAYGGRCALSGLPETSLLDAARIAVDGDELLGQPVITNGLPLTKLHHAAFDGHLIGIDPDCRIVVSRRLLDTRDGLTLEALKSLHGSLINLPRRERDRPDQERLAMRFEAFERAN
jgi:putative restriction endonuclease